jgi:hypothetical protein
LARRTDYADQRRDHDDHAPRGAEHGSHEDVRDVVGAGRRAIGRMSVCRRLESGGAEPYVILEVIG